jgi:UDP-N-acetylmuramoylalanine--D-glutamate ligase
LIGVTGTNGKSTTTALTGNICRASGRPTFCGGNLGNMPLIDAVGGPADTEGGLIVCEVAGFMLETCTSFRPKVAANLNITEDHLDRYGTMDVYAAMKNRIYAWQQPGDFAIANGDDARTVEGAQKSRAQVLMFSIEKEVERGAYLSADRKSILLRGVNDQSETYPLSDLPLIGSHNAANAMAAYLAARLVGVPATAIRDGSRSFKPEPHRMELVGDHKDIVYYDDSKGTNVAAVAASLKNFPRPVVLIAGGVDKGGSYEPMLQALEGVARAIVLIGQAGPLIEKAARDFGVNYPLVFARDMFEAVTVASGFAQPGDAVVLSPACSSYDMFKNYKERGHAFRQAVARVKGA